MRLPLSAALGDAGKPEHRGLAMNFLQKKMQIAVAEILSRGWTLLSDEEMEQMFNYIERHFNGRLRVSLGIECTRRGIHRVYM